MEEVLKNEMMLTNILHFSGYTSSLSSSIVHIQGTGSVLMCFYIPIICYVTSWSCYPDILTHLYPIMEIWSDLFIRSGLIMITCIQIFIHWHWWPNHFSCLSSTVSIEADSRRSPSHYYLDLSLFDLALTGSTSVQRL